jgi:hypothetical protein
MFHTGFGIPPDSGCSWDKLYFCFDLVVRKNEPVWGWTPSVARVSAVVCVMGSAGWQGATRCSLRLQTRVASLLGLPRVRIRVMYSTKRSSVGCLGPL